jgi:hypothetical protein
MASALCSRASTSRELLGVVLLVGVLGCHKEPSASAEQSKVESGKATATNTTGPAAAPSAPTPAAGSGAVVQAPSASAGAKVAASVRAQKVLDAQLAAIKAGSDADLAKTFSKDAVVLARTGHEVDEGELARTVGQSGPHERVLDVKVQKLVAGGNDDAVWLMAEIVVKKQNDEPQEKSSTPTETLRATELLSAAHDWKVVAAAFSESRAPGRLGATFPMVDTTAAGPLAPLLAAPDQLAAALGTDPNIVVVPPDGAAAIGPDAARALLGTLSAHKPALDGAAREVRTDKWGFAQANVAWAEPGGNPYRLTAQLIALPKPDGSWSVVAVQLLAL